jgi:hypothetical protein
MCSRCQDKISTFLNRHPESKCPLYKAYYCSICAVRGHTLSTCQRKLGGAWPSAEAARVAAAASLPEPVPTINIKDDDAVIAAYLSARSLPVSKSAAENRETLAEHAETSGSILVRHWEARIVLPDGAEVGATIDSSTTPADLAASLAARGHEMPKKLAFVLAGGRQIRSFESLTYKDVVRIIARA